MSKQIKPEMTPAEISLFCQQTELLLSSGLSLYDGMPSLAENYASTPYADGLKQVGQIVSETGSLYQGVKDSALFPRYMKEMIRIGETAGQEENVLHGLAAFYDRENNIRKAIRSAITYPLVLIIMMACVIVILVARVLPIFRSIMGNLGDLGADGSDLLALGAGIGRWVLILVAVILFAVLFLICWRHFHPERADRLICRIFPPYAEVRRKLDASRFAGIMQMLLSSGFPLGDSIALMDQVFTDEQTLRRISAIRKAIEEGTPFADAVAESGIFDPLYSRMLRLGFDAGRADQVMGRLNEVYEADMDDRITRLVNTIEPTLVALMTLVIGAILLAVMLPMASILTGVA